MSEGNAPNSTCCHFNNYIPLHISLANLYSHLWTSQRLFKSSNKKSVNFQVPWLLSFFSFSLQFSSVQSLIRVWLFATPWITTRQASLSITNSRGSLRLTSIESVMPSSHLILCCPLLLLPLIPPSIRVFFQRINSSHEVAKVLEFQLQHQSFQRTPRTDL